MAQLTIDLLTVKQAADRIGVSVFTIYNAINSGQLSTYDFGPNAKLLDARDVDRLKKERETNPPKPGPKPKRKAVAA